MTMQPLIHPALHATIAERDEARAELERAREGATVVVPCYHQSEYLPDALNSLELQTVQPFEVIVVDDGSDPEEGERIKGVVSGYGANFRYVWVSNRGLPNARNVGLALCRSEALVPLDSDDWLREDYLEQTLYALPGHDVVLTGIQEHGPHRNGAYAPGFDRPWQDVTVDLLINDYNRFYYAATWRTQFLREIGGWNGRMVNGHEDWDVWVDCLLRDARFTACPEPLFQYRTRPDSMLADADKNWRQENLAEMRRHHRLPSH